MPRPALPVLAIRALLIAALLAGCATLAPPPQPSAFREIQTDVDVFRVTLRWQGAAPLDREERLLTRCAQIAQREGARYFYAVNSDFEMHNEAWLKAGSPNNPVFRVPQPAVEPGQPPPPQESATLTVKLFRAGREPEGYRLYDVQRVLSQRVTRAQGPEEMR